METLAPTSSLPPLGRLLSTPGQKVHMALQNLRSLYFPQQRPTIFLPTKGPLAALRAAHGKGDETPRVIDSGYASAEEEDDEDDDTKNTTTTTTGRGFSTFLETNVAEAEESDDNDDDALEILRGDAFERSFAIKWLTGFMSRAEPWIADVDEGTAEGTLRSELLEEAIRILSAFNGDDDEAEVELTRSFTFPTSLLEEGAATPVLIELNDAPVSSEDHTSVGLQSWGSCILFAKKLCLDPERYLADPRPVECRDGPLRVLELGAGTGMLSIVAAKVLASMDPPPEIVATDYHPDVLANLRRNIQTNFPPKSTKDAPVAVHTLDWESPTTEAPFDRPFDIILAADVVYHPMHAQWIHDCVSKLLLRPTGTSPGGVFWMFMAIRSSGRHEGLDKTVDDTFKRPEDGELGGECREKRLVFVEREAVGKESGVGRADETGYQFSKIAWV